MPFWLTIGLGLWGLGITLLLWSIAANIRACGEWLAIIAMRRS